MLDEQGLRTNEEKILAVKDFPQPSTMRQLRRCLGLASWYRRFVKNFSSIAAPLNNLLKGKLRKGKITWNNEAEQAFNSLKLALTQSPVLRNPDFEQPFIIQTDASLTGLGAVLVQGEGEDERVVAYASRSLTRSEQNYTVTER